MQNTYNNSFNLFTNKKHLFVLPILAVFAIITFFIYKIQVGLIDIDKLALLSSLAIFGVLLLFYGRIELAIITFLPVLISWLFTLGLMALLQIKFDNFNTKCASILFGIGIAYNIFVMQGLLDNYKYGTHSVTAYKLPLFLTLSTTIIGIVILIGIQHPNLKSVTFISIFEIGSAVTIAYFVLPLMFDLLTKQRSNTKTGPITLTNTIISILIFFAFLINTIFLTLAIPFLYLFPISRKRVKFLYHCLICFSSRLVVAMNFTIKKQIVSKEKIDFTKPTIIISNHQSHLDLVLFLKMYPKIIVMTNKWVWNNPFYGFVVRFAEYFPMYKGLEKGFDRIRQKVEEGYSLLMFPEGTRTTDGAIKRYHQGAFKLANDLNLDLQPVLIHGAYECLPKTEFFMRSGKITLKFFDRIKVEPVNSELDQTYKLQSKKMTEFVRDEYQRLKLEIEDTRYYRKHVISQYIFKSPIIEWYVKIKLKLENNFKFLNEIIPRKANIVDIGCGYGYLAYLLKCTSKERTITGIDYDEEKIALANGIVHNIAGIEFIINDITEEEIPLADVYILYDVLHYMPENLQIDTIIKCMDKVSDNGLIIIRDADADLIERTKVTQKTEIQSTKIFRFNKKKYDLAFISGKKISDLAEKKGFTCERFDHSTRTSNITYIIRK